ncbi:hypothetical protein [Mesobacterium pallidum]|uniref:hypothetical protein n=1 Tax=Mesobacterium pallidum TaxID=2872037 RepID=UPI001EE34C28|nr:hypothetical protein [Mesobacterium pallidum]
MIAGHRLYCEASTRTKVRLSWLESARRRTFTFALYYGAKDQILAIDRATISCEMNENKRKPSLVIEAPRDVLIIHEKSAPAAAMSAR